MSSPEQEARLIAEISKAAGVLLRSELSLESPHESLVPLGLALAQVAELFTLLTQGTSSDFRRTL